MIPLSPDTHVTCRTCGASKHWSEYPVLDRVVNKIDSQCKSCRSVYQRNYNYSHKGNGIKCWNGLLDRAGNADGKHASYKDVKVLFTRDEFMQWWATNIVQFYEKYPGQRPSLDRIDNRKDYAFGNIRLIPWEEHKRLKKLVRWQNYLAYLQSHPEKLKSFVSKRSHQLSATDTPSSVKDALTALMGRDLSGAEIGLVTQVVANPQLASVLAYLIGKMP